MKKFISILAALTLMTGCFACSDKKKQNSGNKSAESGISVSDSAVDEPVLQEQDGFREYKAEDFKTINVNITKTDKESPFQLHSIKMSDVDFGSRIAPCKQEEYRDRYKPDLSADLASDDADTQEYARNYLENWEKTCNEPTKGEIAVICFSGNNIYTFVNYDLYCMDSPHEASIFRVDGLTGEVTEVYHHSDPETSFNAYSMFAFRGRIYISVVGKGLTYLDEENKELVPLHHLDDYEHYLLPNATDRCIFTSIKEELKEVPSDYQAGEDEIVRTYANGEKYILLGDERILSEYDPDTDKWTEISRAHVSAEELYSGDFESPLPQIYGKLFAHKEKPKDKRKYDVVTDEYRISTGITGLDILYADHDTVAVRLTSKNVVHVFNIARMEHYVLDCSSLGMNSVYFCGGIVVYPSGQSGTCYYIMPELGLTFPFLNLEVPENSPIGSLSLWMSKEDNDIFFVHSIMKGIDNLAEGQNIYFLEQDFDETYYWLNGDEVNG